MRAQYMHSKYTVIYRFQAYRKGMDPKVSQQKTLLLLKTFKILKFKIDNGKSRSLIPFGWRNSNCYFVKSDVSQSIGGTKYKRWAKK